jgi:hypothetical protein
LASSLRPCLPSTSGGRGPSTSPIQILDLARGRRWRSKHAVVACGHVGMEDVALGHAHDVHVAATGPRSADVHSPTAWPRLAAVVTSGHAREGAAPGHTAQGPHQ